MGDPLYTVGCSAPWGIMSTLGGYFEYHGGYHDAHGRYHDSPHGTEHPHGTPEIPHMHHDIPHGTEHPHGIAHTLYRVLMFMQMFSSLG